MTSLLLGALLVLQPPAPLTVGPVTARPGEKVSGYLDVPAGPDSGTRVPFTIVRGTRAGPTLALIAGTHGAEVAPIVALQRARRAIDPTRLAGTVLMVHVANLPSFLRRTVYYSPVDGKNLNRVYPGRPDGTVSERIAHAITTEIIERADYLVDMHSGDGNEMLRPYAYAGRLGVDPRTDSLSLEVALAWGHTRVVIDTARPRDPRASVYTQNTAHLRRKPAITSEAGFLGLADEEMVQHNLRGVFRLLRHLRMLPEPPDPRPAAVHFVRTEVMRSPGTGIWRAEVTEGQAVAQGAVLGVLSDFFGDTLAVLRAPFAGVMMYVVPTPAMNEGEPVGMVAVPRFEP